jgi:hypothetical protein
MIAQAVSLRLLFAAARRLAAWQVPSKTVIPVRRYGTYHRFGSTYHRTGQLIIGSGAAKTGNTLKTTV